MNIEKNAEQVRNIPIETWHELVSRDIDLSVNIQLYGNSMRPLIRYKRDLVTIRSVNRKLCSGDIVLFRRADGKYVVHRIIKCRGCWVQTLGDNCRTPDAPVTAENVIGLVTYVQRGKHRLHVDTSFGRIMGRVWSISLPVRNFVRRFLGPVKRTVKSLFRRTP